jgi:hypothetical protein
VRETLICRVAPGYVGCGSDNGGDVDHAATVLTRLEEAAPDDLTDAGAQLSGDSGMLFRTTEPLAGAGAQDEP